MLTRYELYLRAMPCSSQFLRAELSALGVFSLKLVDLVESLSVRLL
jgi:hypothetical protein